MNTPLPALIACLLSGWPQAPKCHEEAVARGPAVIGEIKPALFEALRGDPGREVRERNNAMALTASATRRDPAHPKTGSLRKAKAAAEELGRLGEWKPLLSLGTITAVEGLARLEEPPPKVLKALARWAGGKDARLRYASVDALKAYGPKAAPIVPEMIALLDRGDDARFSALKVLEGLGPAAEAAVPRLGVLLKDKGWKDAAYSALSEIKTPEANRLLDDNPLWVPVSP
ncbi:MAG: HEAT repeat domain-containing protein [Elusimicrobiota bacterium]|nr:HEAT repeat domain-containing protein [Elusimicrobiota bacterium]